jgi:large subunit ribosomal protein L1
MAPAAAAASACVGSVARHSLTLAVRRAITPTTAATISSPTTIPVAVPRHHQQIRHAVGVGSGYKGTRQLSDKEKIQKLKEKQEQKRKNKRGFHTPKLDDFPMYSLCDAMRILRAAEVGQPPSTIKYEVFVRLKTQRSGPVVKNRIKLPHPISADDRVAVICPENSALSRQAIASGAVLAGEETLFNAIRSGQIPFTKLICHTDSEAALKKANLGRILGPKGLMPNKKNNTITSNFRSLISSMIGSINYRERTGVIRLVIGQLSHTPKQLAENIQTLMREVKAAVRKINIKNEKKFHEIVLSSTHGPGLSLNGNFNSTDNRVTPEHLAGAM